MPPLPPWQRVLGILLFGGGGVAAAAWSLHELVGWLGPLGHGAGVIETDNVILGLSLIGAGMLLLVPELVLPRMVARSSEEGRTRLGLAVLGTMAAGLVLVLLGQVVITVVMEGSGYRACRVGGRGRVTEVTWARGDAACPPGPPNR